ncbi:chitinase C-terminal domain-containing protein [Hahella sp. HN01]|uniref:chitinase C-terminal domain-containing protein n=1 Tax=Hahella sp. HN01 TaxID=2847262 RepID=UPI001C1EC658|nr:glycosyl hydrolase family 18 protein [Hahella sp. HN01]MBU6953095.1 chitinase C-terminal domain-containing protein [Hahella sp. HN01]
MKMKLLTATLIAAGALSQSAFAYDCAGLSDWDSGAVYTGGAKVKHKNSAYEAAYWSQGADPETHSGDWQEWKPLGQCDDGGPVDNKPPSVTLTAPKSGSEYAVGDNVVLSADASDEDGSIAKVTFMVDDKVVGEDDSAPYSVEWKAELGDHTVSATAVDDDDADATSVKASIKVSDDDTPPDNQAPTASVTSPKAGEEFNVDDNVNISVDAADADGSVSKVEFYVDNALIGEDDAAPYELDWKAKAGGHRIAAKAIDDKGLSGMAPAVAIKVNGGTDPGGEDCRPEGLYQTPGVDVPYCSIYDENGREKMGADHPRRIIGYFTSWRTGKNGAPSYLASDIPWEKLTHINYAFAHVDGNNKISVGNVNNPENAATGLTWDGVEGAEMDPSYSYKGHFNLLNKFKKQYPNVKTLISVGGWAETGGYFDDDGKRVDSGGFYTMTTNADNSINQQGINTFADSVVAFLRSYGFDGVDIDYEYPTSMNDAGNPDDFSIANARRAGLMASYVELMKTLREKLDAASAEDGKHYMLTIASPSSGYLLRGMEVMQITPYLDYVNIMSYDLHGAWNQFVGPNAALYDTGEDVELKAWNYYNTSQYQRIGYLNTDWAYKYFRGTMQAGRINIGVPYYTRGWQGVNGGDNGLWGTASAPDQNNCPPGTGSGDKNDCGNGAVGIDNIWHDLDKQGNEMGAGSNPLWHAKNLAEGVAGSYIADYGLDPANDPTDVLTGSYSRHYDSTAVAPWLWNAEKRVFLSIEDEESIGVKAKYVADNGIGGVMFWELAGDYDWNADKGEYFMGDTLTTQFYDAFKNATPYGDQVGSDVPATSLDIKYSISGFKLGDQNYPINPKLKITNNSGQTIPGGATFEFNVPTAIPDTISDQSGVGLKVIASGANSSGNNIGGLENDHHKVAFTLKNYQALADGESMDITLNYHLPMSTPSSWRVKIGGATFALKQEHPELPAGSLDGGDNGDGGDDGGDDGGNDGGSCADANVDPSKVNVYPNWTQSDWQGNPNHAGTGDLMSHNKVVYRAGWWTQSTPGSDGSWTLVCRF